MLRKYSSVAKKKGGGNNWSLILSSIKIHPHDYASILYCLRYKFCGRSALSYLIVLLWG